MSEPPQGPEGLGTTLAGGVQDIAALLPLIGTDQCEKHVGSALEGGYLYAAATPLSIFGSLGIVKIGISILISSISIPKLSVSFNPKLSMAFRGRRWLGARLLDNAGFKPVGAVAPLIAMDKKRYKAETLLVEILKEKHIEHPEALSIEWRSTEWNLMLVICTMVAAVCGIVPYIHFTLPQFRPSVAHSLWIFPILRIVGSCVAAVCCQFLIQSHVISLMKNRIVFMIMDRTLLDDCKSKNGDKSIHPFRWDESRPSEECVWNLERYLLSTQLETSEFSKPEDIRNKLSVLHKKHTQTSPFSHAFIFISWIILFLSLPATVAGYIGCFTVVSGSRGNGPLIWLGLEAALSIIRILLWAWNPKFDERTSVTVGLELDSDAPLVTTEKKMEVVKDTDMTLALVPERQFLERITSYTGPLEQFQSPENIALYFTLTENEAEQKYLYLTVFDVNRRIAVTLHGDGEEGLTYTDAVVTCNKIASEMEATLQSVIDKDHPWRTNHAIIFKSLSDYYFSVIHALNRSQYATTNNRPSHRTFLETLTRYFRSPAADIRTQNEAGTVTSAPLPRKWNLLPKPAESNDQSPISMPKPLSLTAHDKLYLQRGYEHYLKTKLVANWSRWIFIGLGSIRYDARFDCHHALTDRTSDKAKWELIELDRQLASEWARREWSLLVSSFELEDILHQRMEECVKQVVTEWENDRLGVRLRSEFRVERRKRLKKEREEAKERMDKEMKNNAERAEAEGRAWRDHSGDFSPKVMWEDGQQFIDKQWQEAIEGRETEGESRLDQLVESNTPRSSERESEKNKARRIFVEQVGSRFTHWQSQRRSERDEMDATIKRIRDADFVHLDDAYQYPEPSWNTFGKFVRLVPGLAVAPSKVFFATVYDLEGWGKEVICDVIQNSATRSVINVGPDLVNSIPENDHLLYLSSYGDHWQEPPFIQRNRERWWKQQTNNSSTFYFSPQYVRALGHCVASGSGTIAHIFIFLRSRTRLRLRLLHYCYESTSVSIREKSNMLQDLITTDEIPTELQLQDFELDQLEPGEHELELVVDSIEGGYCLRDIFVEFFEDLVPDKDVGIEQNASDLPTGIEEGNRSPRDS